MEKVAAGKAKGRQKGGSVANVAHALKGIGFPARKSDLLDRAPQCRAAPLFAR
jgi:hypothetical protein